MKRTLVFLLLGSTLVYCVAWTVYMPPGTGLGKLTDPIFGFYAVMLFVLSLFVSAITRLVDGHLARTFPIGLSTPLTAFAGGAIPLASG